MGVARRKKQQPPQPLDLQDVVTLLLSADAFRECSRPFRQKVAGLRTDAASAEASKDLGGMVASATNLALSVELYLKALRMVSGLPENPTHNLHTLYTELPLDLRQSAEAVYEAKPKPNPAGEAIGMAITRPKNTPPPKIGTDYSLPSILDRSSAVFETWRYPHEADKPGKARQRYEFHYLGVAADVLHEHVVYAVEELKRRLQAQDSGKGPSSRP
jgi:hypothetical protein